MPQPLYTLPEDIYYAMGKEAFDAIQPQLDALLTALEESIKRQDVWTATNIALLLPTWMIADQLKEFAAKLENLSSSRVRSRSTTLEG